ncbi:MAG: rubrerythrin family protein [Kiritimatiellaeota bacterium]|nr:rubrerythrin family protein [Kiritimatiellota bacterium]
MQSSSIGRREALGIITLSCIGGVAVAQTKIGNVLGTAGEAKAALKGLSENTVKDLQAAYNGEMNANARYTAFAKKASEEGYKSVAVLFKAAAASEAIHAKKFAAALRAGGAEPEATIADPDVKATEENLKVAIAGEKAEATEVYPKAAEAALKAGDTAAAKAFKDALAAEAKHAQFFSDASANLEAWKPAGKAFALCPTCGYTVAAADLPKNCPLCGVVGSKFDTFK